MKDKSKPKVWLVAIRRGFDIGPDIGANQESVRACIDRLSGLEGVYSVEERPTDDPSWRVTLEHECYDDEGRLEELLQAVLREFRGYEPLYYTDDGTMRRAKVPDWKKFIARPFKSKSK